MTTDPYDDSVLVVGASHAAVQFADALRQHGHRGPVMLVGREPHAPYQRPPLSKSWLTGAATRQSLELRGAEHYGRHAIEVVGGATVTGLDRLGDDGRAGYTVQWRDESGVTRTRPFDRVVLASGARPRRLSLPGGDHPDVLVLRDLDDASRLVDRWRAGPVVVVGGGFIGLEVAATLHSLGADVTVVEAGRRLMGRAVAPATAGFLLAAHRDAGIDVLLSAVPEHIEITDAGVRAVVLADGRRLPAATVVVGVGVLPRTELAKQLGLACDGGIVVDDRCLASDGHTLAIGDCTVHQTADGALMRLESVDNAVEQATIAAATVLGAEPAVRPYPWFWSDQGEWKLQIVGRVAGHHEVVVRTDPTKPRRRVALYFDDDDGFLGAECVNAPADFVALRTALSRGVRPTPGMVGDTSVPLRKALTPTGITR